MEKYFGFFEDLLSEYPAYVKEQEFYYEDTVELYDQISQGSGEFSLFMQVIALHGGPVLDLCCGSGRLTIPTAKLGVDVTGVDLSADMLGRLETILDQKHKRLKDRIHLYCQDMTKLDLPHKFNVIMIGATSLRLLPGSFTEFFDHMNEWLEEGGCLCFDVEDIPAPDSQTAQTEEMVTAGISDYTGRLSIVLMQRYIDYAKRAATVNMAKILPATENKVLLTSTGYRIFDIEEIRTAARESRFGNIETLEYNNNGQYFCKLVK